MTKRDEALTVFNAWKATRPRPHLCRFTADRQKLIEARLRLGYSAADLVALVRYANEADEGWPRWMRGDNPRRRAYLDLTNLLRVEKLAERVELALSWLEDGCGEGDHRPATTECRVDLGPLAFGAAGEA